MATYQHGVYNQEQATSLTTPIRSSAALQVIFGTAPVHLNAPVSERFVHGGGRQLSRHALHKTRKPHILLIFPRRKPPHPACRPFQNTYLYV